MKTFFTAVLIAFIALLLPACAAQQQGLTVLPALKAAGLQGRLVFIMYRQKGSQLMELNLATGAARALFDAPEKSWLAVAEISPDGSSVLMAYAPPPPQGQAQLTNTDLYRMPADGSAAPQPLVERSEPNESYAYPNWSPDGKAVYYAHSKPSTTTRLGVETNIERLVPGGQAEIILRGATSPRLSPDGARLVYLGLSEFTSQNSLYLANADGSNPTELVSAKTFPIVDAPLFSPDGSQVYFSAPVEGSGLTPSTAAPSQARLRWPWSVQTVTAHSEPADWFQVSASGGQPRQVSQVRDINMVAAFSPDGQWLAYASQKGLFVMKPDGSQLTQLASLVGMGSIAWLE